MYLHNNVKLTWLKGLKAPRLVKSAPHINSEAKTVEIITTERKINDTPSSNELNCKTDAFTELESSGLGPKPGFVS